MWIFVFFPPFSTFSVNTCWIKGVGPELNAAPWLDEVSIPHCLPVGTAAGLSWFQVKPADVSCWWSPSRTPSSCGCEAQHSTLSWRTTDPLKNITLIYIYKFSFLQIGFYPFDYCFRRRPPPAVRTPQNQQIFTNMALFGFIWTWNIFRLSRKRPSVETLCAPEPLNQPTLQHKVLVQVQFSVLRLCSADISTVTEIKSSCLDVSSSNSPL